MVKPRRTCLELQSIVEISCFGIGYVSKLGDCLDRCSICTVDLWLFLVVFQVLFIGGLLMPCKRPLLVAYPGIFDRGCVSSISRPSSQSTQWRHSPTCSRVFKNKFLTLNYKFILFCYEKSTIC